MFDPRDWSKAVNKGKIDNQLSLMQCYLNPVNNLFYVMSKGSQVMDVFYHDQKNATLMPIHKYKSAQTTLLYMYFLPRNCVDPFEHEIDRAIWLGDMR